MDDIDRLLMETEIIINGEKVKPAKITSVKKVDFSIDDLINDIEIPEGSHSPQISIIDNNKNEVIVRPEPEIDLDEKNSLADRIVQNSLDIIKNAAMVFDSFSSDVIHGKDRSTSSKETMIKALDVQNSANTNLIQLAKTLKADIKGGDTNILISSALSAKKTGIDMGNIRSHFKD